MVSFKKTLTFSANQAIILTKLIDKDCDCFDRQDRLSISFYLLVRSFYFVYGLESIMTLPKAMNKYETMDCDW